MTDQQAIAKRSSRRAYTGGVPEEYITSFADLCADLSAQKGVYLALIPDAKALFGGFKRSYGMFQGVESLFVLAARPEDEHGLEKLGHAGERLVLEATKLGLGTCWVGGTFDKAAIAKAVPDGWRLECVIPLGSVAESMTSKERFIYAMAHRGSGKSPQDLYTADGPVPDWFARGMQAVHAAPSAVNAKPARLHYTGGRVEISVPGGRPMQYIDLGIAKLHFEIGAGGLFPEGNPAVFQKT